MKKWITLLLIMLVTIPIAQAAICEEQIENGTSCLMTTPYVACGTYDIIDVDNETIVVDDGALTALNDTHYYFNFSLGIGNYLIVLCDYTSRPFRVVEQKGDSMVLGVIILLPMILGFFFLVGAATLSEEHDVLRIFLFLASIITFFASFHFGMVSVVKYFDFPVLEDLIGTTTYWIGLVFFIIIVYFILYLFYKAVQVAAQRKKERLQY